MILSYSFEHKIAVSFWACQLFAWGFWREVISAITFSWKLLTFFVCIHSSRLRQCKHKSLQEYLYLGLLISNCLVLSSPGFSLHSSFYLTGGKEAWSRTGISFPERLRLRTLHYGDHAHKRCIIGTKIAVFLHVNYPNLCSGTTGQSSDEYISVGSCFTQALAGVLYSPWVQLWYPARHCSTETRFRVSRSITSTLYWLTIKQCTTYPS